MELGLERAHTVYLLYTLDSCKKMYPLRQYTEYQLAEFSTNK